MRLHDLTNHVFGRWTVIGRSENDARNHSRWICRCECGTEKVLHGNNLRNGKTKSCGCVGKTTHGHTKGRRCSSLYGVWAAIIQRCTNPDSASYPQYGGRGISVCERWKNSFADFLEDVGERPSPMHSIDRKDNSRGYEPGNVQWATRSEQGRNTRRNRLVTVDGVTRCVAEWAEISGVTPSAITQRLNAGWSDRDAITKPYVFRRRLL